MREGILSRGYLPVLNFETDPCIRHVELESVCSCSLHVCTHADRFARHCKSDRGVGRMHISLAVWISPVFCLYGNITTREYPIWLWSVIWYLKEFFCFFPFLLPFPGATALALVGYRNSNASVSLLCSGECMSVRIEPVDWKQATSLPRRIRFPLRKRINVVDGDYLSRKIKPNSMVF